MEVECLGIFDLKIQPNVFIMKKFPWEFTTSSKGDQNQ